MIREIITIAISVLSATGILGIGTKSILNRMQKQDARQKLSLIHISEPTRLASVSRMPSSA